MIKTKNLLYYRGLFLDVVTFNQYRMYRISNASHSKYFKRLSDAYYNLANMFGE